MLLCFLEHAHGHVSVRIHSMQRVRRGSLFLTGGPGIEDFSSVLSFRLWPVKPVLLSFSDREWKWEP